MTEIIEYVVVAMITPGLTIPILQMLRRPRDLDWLRELHARYNLQLKLDKNLSTEGRAALDRIMWDKYR